MSGSAGGEDNFGSVLRVERAVQLARTEGDERGLRLLARLERTGEISPDRARALRLDFYCAMAQWAHESGQARHSAVLPSDPLQAEVRQLLEENPQREAQHRRNTSARRADRTAVQQALGHRASENDTVLLLRELTDLEAQHRLQEARTRVAAFIASCKPESQLAHVVLAWAERLMIDPAPLIPHLPAGQHASAADERKRFRAALPPAVHTYRLIPLGRNCLPWRLPNRWGLRRPSDLFELDLPFNNAVHELDQTKAAISNDFAGYADVGELRAVMTPRGHKVAYNLRYRALWNDHKGAYWLDNHFARLRTYIEESVVRFRRALAGERLAFLVSKLDPETPLQTLEPLLEVLRARAPGARVAVIAASQQPGAAAPVERIAPAIFHIRAPLPRETYIWHDENEYNSTEGLAFERHYVSGIVAALTALE